MGRKGFTLTEVLMAVVVVGILASAAVANYRTAILRARFDAARVVLMQIYQGEQYYRDSVSTSGNAYVAPATDAEWRNFLNMDNPNIGSPILYTIAPGVAPPSFTATARFGAAAPFVFQGINDSKTLCPPTAVSSCSGGAMWNRP